MKKKLGISFIACLLAFQMSAQFTASYSVGYGEYKMKGVSELLEYVYGNMKEQLPGIPLKIVDDFPNYINHSMDFGYRWKRHEAGLRFSYLTTGGKVAYADYSGSYEGKLIVNGCRVGLNYRIYAPIQEFEKMGALHFFAELSPAVIFTKLKSKEHIKIFELEQSPQEQLDLNASSFSLLPQVGLKWFVTPLISFHVGGGYEFQFESKFKQKGEKTYIESDWTGFRLNAGVAVTLGK